MVSNGFFDISCCYLATPFHRKYRASNLCILGGFVWVFVCVFFCSRSAFAVCIAPLSELSRAFQLKWCKCLCLYTHGLVVLLCCCCCCCRAFIKYRGRMRVGGCWLMLSMWWFVPCMCVLFLIRYGNLVRLYTSFSGANVYHPFRFLPHSVSLQLTATLSNHCVGVRVFYVHVRAVLTVCVCVCKHSTNIRVLLLHRSIISALLLSFRVS